MITLVKLPFVFISNTTIGSNVMIGHNGRISSNWTIQICILGNNVIIHPGVRIGQDGFGYSLGDAGFKKFPHIGRVIIQDNVEIGSNSSIDRATIGSTIINNGVKLDNQIQVAHNVEIGENTVIAAQCGIAGSSKIGKNCMFGGQVGVIGHVKVGDNVKIAAQSAVSSDIKDNEIIKGSPAIPTMNFNRSYIHFKNLPEIVKKIDKKD